MDDYLTVQILTRKLIVHCSHMHSYNEHFIIFAISYFQFSGDEKRKDSSVRDNSIKC